MDNLSIENRMKILKACVKLPINVGSIARITEIDQDIVSGIVKDLLDQKFLSSHSSINSKLYSNRYGAGFKTTKEGAQWYLQNKK